MNRYACWILVYALAGTGCSGSPKDPAPPTGPPKPTVSGLEQPAAVWPANLEEQMGKAITVEGTALESKLGAFVQSGEKVLWMDGMANWPEGFYLGGDKGRKIRVTGTLIKLDDMPVYIADPAEKHQPQGIAVANKEELEQKKWRYLLTNATCKLIE